MAAEQNVPMTPGHRFDRVRVATKYKKHKSPFYESYLNTTPPFVKGLLYPLYFNGDMASQVSTIQKRCSRLLKLVRGEIIYAADAKLTDEQIDKLPFDLYREGFGYYGKTHAYPNSTFSCTLSSLLDSMNFGAASNMNLINQPLLMLSGAKADSLYMTLGAFKEARNTKDKELFLIDRATHIETYWQPQDVERVMGKLTGFFGKILK